MIIELGQQMELVKVSVKALEKAWKQIRRHPAMRIRKRPGYSFVDMMHGYSDRKRRYSTLDLLWMEEAS